MVHDGRDKEACGGARRTRKRERGREKRREAKVGSACSPGCPEGRTHPPTCAGGWGWVG
jgi:hypothetical protein